MKEILKNIILAVLATVALLAVLTFGVALPTILGWIASFIGEPMTWILFLATMIGICYACVKFGK